MCVTHCLFISLIRLDLRRLGWSHKYFVIAFFVVSLTCKARPIPIFVLGCGRQRPVAATPVRHVYCCSSSSCLFEALQNTVSLWLRFFFEPLSNAEFKRPLLRIFFFPGWLFWGVRRVAIAKLVPSSVFTFSFSRKVPKHTICFLFQSILEKVKLNSEVIENGLF